MPTSQDCQSLYFGSGNGSIASSRTKGIFCSNSSPQWNRTQMAAGGTPCEPPSTILRTTIPGPSSPFNLTFDPTSIFRSSELMALTQFPGNVNVRSGLDCLACVGHRLITNVTAERKSPPLALKVLVPGPGEGSTEDAARSYCTLSEDCDNGGRPPTTLPIRKSHAYSRIATSGTRTLDPSFTKKESFARWGVSLDSDGFRDDAVPMLQLIGNPQGRRPMWELRRVSHSGPAMLLRGRPSVPLSSALCT
jgi:hypothetical protein